MALPFGVLPAPFLGDEHVPIEGVSRPLIPARTDVTLQFQAWAEFDTQSPGGSSSTGSPRGYNHWEALWAASETGADDSSLATPLASGPSDGTIYYSQTARDASIVLRKLNRFPAQVVEQWQPARTDEVFYWLKNIHATGVSPSSLSGLSNTTANVIFEPTRQDALLLRFCELFFFFFLFSFFFFLSSTTVSSTLTSTSTSTSRQLHLALQGLPRRRTRLILPPVYETIRPLLPKQYPPCPDGDLYVRVLPERDKSTVYRQYRRYGAQVPGHPYAQRAPPDPEVDDGRGHRDRDAAHVERMVLGKHA